MNWWQQDSKRIMEGEKHPSTTIAVLYFSQLCTNNLDTNDSEKITDGLFCITLGLKKRMNNLKIVINGILPRYERNTVRRQKSFIVKKLLLNKRTIYINTDIHYLSPDGDWIC